MQISNNYNQPQFTSIHRIMDASPQDAQKIFLTTFATNLKSQKPATVMVGSNPFEASYIKFLYKMNDKKLDLYKQICEVLKESKSKMPKTDKFDVWVFDGEHCNIPKDFMKTHTMFRIPENFPRIYKTFQSFIENVKDINAINGQYNQIFIKNFVDKSFVREYNSPKAWFKSVVSSK